jgi:hypothetical protein
MHMVSFLALPSLLSPAGQQVSIAAGAQCSAERSEDAWSEQLCEAVHAEDQVPVGVLHGHKLLT